MTDSGTAADGVQQREGFEFSLRTNGTSTQRVLMRRLWTRLDQDRGTEPVWQDIAVFSSYNEAEGVLRRLRAGS